MQNDKSNLQNNIIHQSEIPMTTPLSESQKGIYLECINEPASLMYNIPTLCRLPAKTDLTRFAKAVKEVCSAHKILNVTVESPHGIPSMIYKEKDITVTEKETDDIKKECDSFIRPFDLENGPLFRFEIIKCKNESYFLFDIHHIIFDGRSAQVLLSQIAKSYEGKEIPKEALTQFDVSAYDKTLFDSDDYKSAKEFCKNKFDGIEWDSLPVPDIEYETEDKRTERVTINSKGYFDTSEIESFKKETEITETSLFMCAFSYALAKFNGTNESGFCTVGHGRHDERLKDTFGMFVKTLPVHSLFDENSTVIDTLSSMQKDFSDTLKNDCISFGELASEYGINTDIMFVYQGKLFGNSELLGQPVSADPLLTREMAAKLNFMLFKGIDDYELRVNYQNDLYSEEFIDSFARMYLLVIKEMLSKKNLSDINLTDDTALKTLEDINKTESDWNENKTVIDIFREQAKKTPDNTCLVYCNQKYTYREVDEITDRLAKHLVNCGIKKETMVGVLIHRNEYMLLCALGILKSGGAYLPLDPSYPAERLNLMMKDSEAAALITSPDLTDVISSDFQGMRMTTDEIPSLSDTDTALPVPSPKDLFIMIYTSGSTGTPKGVQFDHSNTHVTCEYYIKYYQMNESTKVASYVSYGFDGNTIELYPVIMSGGEVHIISEDIRLDLIAVRDYCNENGITQIVMTTQVGRQFAVMGGHKTIKHLSMAGEKLTPFTPPSEFNTYNLYGPSEGSVQTSAFKIDRLYKDVPIGELCDNIKAYIVDKQGKLLPPGAVGELWISGPHVTRGYKNRPEKTNEVYANNPFTNQKGYERIYKTGDIIRLHSDGNLQFVGRRDGMVKVRGFRVELTEIEEVIRRFEGIKDATVAAFDEPSGGKYVCAYYVSDNEISKEKLSDFIKNEKPPYMVPAVFMQIDRIPLNQNHKVNKKALPVPQREAEDKTPPENETQKKIFDIISDIIGHNDFGINTDIYDAGLTSIGAVKLNVTLAETFGVPVKIADIKANNTIKKLDAFLSSVSADDDFEISENYPLTKTQEGIFIECMANPGTTIYNIPLCLRLGDGVDLSRLEKAIRTAVDAHPYVKTVLFTNEKGDIRAKRNDTQPVEIKREKCEELPECRDLRKPFNLTGDSLYRICIYETKNGNYLYMDFHHIICDGTSETILLSDIDKSYADEKINKETFTGYEIALSEEKQQNSDEYEKSKSYWKNLLSDCDGTTLIQKSPETGKTGAGYVSYEGAQNADTIRKYCNQNNITLNAFFNSVFSFVLGRYTGRDSVCYATIFNGRSDSRSAMSVTMSVKTIPVYVKFDKESDIRTYIRNVQSQLVDSMSNDQCSFAELVSECGVDANLIFAYQGDDFTFDSLCGEPAKLIEMAPEVSKAQMAINVYISNGHFRYTAEYDNEIYNEALTKSLIDALDTAIGSFTKESLIKNVSLLSKEAITVYDEMNDSDTEIKNILCHEFIEEIAKEKPEYTAVIAKGEALTFKELNEKANIYAHKLIDMGIGKDKIAGVLLERSKEIMICELAIMKAGGAFLPMVPEYPDDRIKYCLENSEAPVIITTEEIKNQRALLFTDDCNYSVITIEELEKGTKTDNLNLEISDCDMAYCIYTSGSTGTPKGVMIEHRNFSNYLQVNTIPLKYYNEKDDSTCLATSSVAFDMSIDQIWLPLCAGRTICMATDEEFHNPLLLCELMEKYNVGSMTTTPSFLNNMVTTPGFDKPLKNLNTIVVGAEAFPESLYRALSECAPAVQIINGYGPTETTICCSVKELTDPKKITIGRPEGNVKYFVLDSYGNIMPPYASGELIICGKGVGRGYIKLPEKTSASFFELNGLPAYHSGDRVRLTKDAEIEYGGRIDNQVKLRGFRIELDEIEKAICDYEDIKQAKVIVRNNGNEDYLAGFFTASKTIDTVDLTNMLKSKLTYYMVPSVLMQLERMPLTQNGKIDKKALPETTISAHRSSGKRAAKKSLEQRLCEIFASVLSMDEIYADDNFFELGGTSLSASKVTMLLMSDNIDVKYGDIFDNPTPEELAAFIENRNAPAPSENTEEDEDKTKTREALKYNMVKYAPEVKRKPLGNLLLTGAVGFLGIHILKEFLETEGGHVYCLARKGEYDSAEIRLKTMLVYYFSRGFEEELENRITLIDADITDEGLYEKLKDVPFDTVINCAACVKHFADDDSIEKINVKGVENLIDVCKKQNKKLIQISTVSVPGLHTKESYEKQIKMHENELFVIDDMDNKYGISKYHAELRMFDAIESGMRGKVIRVGNLMGRHSDGEFQANMETNMFMSGIRGFATMGKYPISHMTDPMTFSPVDCTARAVILLSGTNDKFTAFNCDNRYGFDEMKLIDACNKNGISIVPEDDDVYYEEYRQKLADDSLNIKLTALAAYDLKDTHAVSTDNLFTTNILYRIGFSWPLVDDAYLERAINSIMTLDYFDLDSLEND